MVVQVWYEKWTTFTQYCGVWNVKIEFSSAWCNDSITWVCILTKTVWLLLPTQPVQPCSGHRYYINPPTCNSYSLYLKRAQSSDYSLRSFHHISSCRVYVLLIIPKPAINQCGHLLGAGYSASSANLPWLEPAQHCGVASGCTGHCTVSELHQALFGSPTEYSTHVGFSALQVHILTCCLSALWWLHSAI